MMNAIFSKKIFLIFPAFGFFILCTASFSSVYARVLKSTPPTPRAAGELQTVKVALVLPLTGQNKAVGYELYKSALISQEIINDNERSKGFAGQYKLEIIPYNDACNTKKAVNVAKKIISGKDINFVIGHFCSDATYAVVNIYKNKGILHFSPFSGAPDLSVKAPNTFFRLSGRTDVEAQTSAQWLAEFGKRKKIGIVYQNNLYGSGLAAHVVKNLHKYGYNCVSLSSSGKIPCERVNHAEEAKIFVLAEANNQDDYIKVIRNFDDQEIGLMFYAGYHRGLAKIIRLYQQRKIKRPVLFGGGSLNNRDFWTATEGAAENVLFTLTEDVTRDLSDRELNQLRIFQKSLTGSDSVQSVTASVARAVNLTFRERAEYMRRFHDRYGYFPDTYGARVHAVTEIIKEIAISDNYGLWNKKEKKEKDKKNEEGNITDKNLYATQMWAKLTAEKIKDAGIKADTDNPGFQTILGSVNFDQIGDWSNVKYFIYRWVNQTSKREWVDLLEEPKPEKNEREAQKNERVGDYIRVF